MALTHAGPGQVVDIGSPPEGAPAEKSTAIVKTEQFEAIRLVLKAGAKMQPHKVDNQFTLQCLGGQAVLLHDGQRAELSAGSWIYLDQGVLHSVEAIKDSTFLLTIILTP